MDQGRGPVRHSVRASWRAGRCTGSKGINPPVHVGVVGISSKSPQAGWSKTPGIYCLTVLEARNLKSRCWQSPEPSEVSRNCPWSRARLQSLAVLGVPDTWVPHSNLCLCSLGSLPCVSVSGFPPPKDASHWKGPHQSSMTSS